MNTQVGKSVGFALLLAAGLLAALFAMGVFSASGVGAQTPPAGVDTPDLQDTESITVGDATEQGYKFYVMNEADGSGATPVAIGTIQATVDGTLNTDAPTEVGTDITEAVLYDITAATETTAPGFPTGNGTEGSFDIDYTTGEITYDGSSFVAEVSLKVWAYRALKTAVADGPDTYAEPVPTTPTAPATPVVRTATNSAIIQVVPFRYATTNKVPGSNQRLELIADIAVALGGSITVKLDNFGVPSSIDADDIGIGANNPSDVDVSGKTVTLFWGSGDEREAIVDTTPSTIVFRKSAGITLPIRHGAYDTSITSTGTVDGSVDGLVNRVRVERTVTVDEEEAVRGTDITITGKGFADGSAEVYIVGEDGPSADDGSVIGTATISDGSFTLTVSNSSTTNFPKDTEVQINAEDSTGARDESAATHEITPTFTFSSDEATPGQKITITLKDIGGPVEDLKFRNTERDALDYDADDETFDLQIPSSAPLGASRVSFAASGVSLNKNIEIVAKPLELSPATAVPGQEIRIEASGYSKSERFYDNDDNVDTNDGSLEIGGADALDGREPEAVSDGSVSITVNVPAGTEAGDAKVELVGHSGRVATATLTVPEPEITLDPEEGLRGSDVTISGTGFPANDFVQIKYQDFRRDAANPVFAPAGNTETDSEGNFSVTIKVPSYARIGQTQTVIAVTQINDLYEEDEDGIEAEHSTPDPDISIDPSTAVAGGGITVSGSNYPGFSSVTLIEIGGTDVTPIPSVTTDAWGAFTASNVQVPQLDPAQYTVKVQVGGDDGPDDTVFIQITDQPISSAPADVFASLGDNLQVVWQYDNATSMWASYDPAAPAELNDLAEVSSGDIVWVEVTADQEFQGKQLYAGWNLITLN